MKIEDEFKSIIHSLKSDYYFIACSGGVDSMVLLHIAQKFNLQCHVLHINYNLRGDESILDSLFLKNYCKKNNIPISIHEVQLKKQLKESGGNLQNEARKIRYDFFQSNTNQIENSKLLIAHHLDDQIETFWLQLYRGSGLKGMAGMSQSKNEIIRPLLTISKKELIDYAIQNKISWREDMSNLSSDYQRNLFRNEYIPFLNSEISTINNAVLLLQQIFQENLNEIANKINELKNELIKNNYIDFNKLSNLLIVEIIELFRALSIPNYQLKAFLKLFNSQKGSKIKLENTSGLFHEIIREENGFSFIPTNEKRMLPQLKIDSFDILPEKFEKTIFYFDSKKIKGQLKVRFWHKGDRIFPIGMTGSKLISDVITNAKIPHSERNKQLVIFDEEKILACVGLCIDRRTIATKKQPNYSSFFTKRISGT